MIREAIELLIQGKDLDTAQAEECMQEIMSGNATPAQIAAFLTSLRMKGETVNEVTALATVMRKNAVTINPSVNSRLIDVVGTGGDAVKTFNVSTTVALVASGAGVPVAKHGNRSVTSKCGSADLLETVGVNLNAPASDVERSIQEVGIGFLFAPAFHPAMKNVAPVRREIGIRTVFNILGPLTNPAHPKAQLTGVYAPRLLKPVAEVLRNLGVEETMVVYGLDGLDEISITGKTRVAWLKNGKITQKELRPRDLKLKLAQPHEIAGVSPAENAKLLVRVLKCWEARDSPRLSMVLANAAAALLVAGKVDNLQDGIEVAKESISSGAAYKKLVELISSTKGDMSKLEGISDSHA